MSHKQTRGRLDIRGLTAKRKGFPECGMKKSQFKIVLGVLKNPTSEKFTSSNGISKDGVGWIERFGSKTSSHFFSGHVGSVGTRGRVAAPETKNETRRGRLVFEDLEALRKEIVQFKHLVTSKNFELHLLEKDTELKFFWDSSTQCPICFGSDACLRKLLVSRNPGRPSTTFLRQRFAEQDGHPTELRYLTRASHAQEILQAWVCSGKDHSSTPQPKKKSKGETNSLPPASVIPNSENSCNLTTALISKFIKVSRVSLSPEIWGGSCGLGYLTEGSLTPLRKFLDMPFLGRAYLAISTLHFIGELMEGDTDWVFLALNLTLDNLAVTDSGEISLLDFSEIVLLDLNLIEGAGSSMVKGRPSPTASGMINTPCEYPCFQSFLREIRSARVTNESSFEEDELSQCSKAVMKTTLMHVLVCQFVLSDPEFKLPTTEELTGYTFPAKGLLHSPPAEHRQELSRYLSECIHEPLPSQKLEVVDRLVEYLTRIVDASNKR
ncbi:unnamed protein product [Cyprideis torosa]|uniref:FAM69 protein-kinase domain-containing protein n=1 Tax=Cyprideis torosa TaxID=163714 RepID=A0A7R8WH89_9CRUS|nr:unnamed protein product [Cyprideis torosa]CAG0899078.1 unnamed protein product [Cyprideis torosa]